MTYTVEDYINHYEELSNEELLEELIRYSGSPASKRYRALRKLILDKMEGEKKMKWYVVQNGEIVFSGTKEECEEVIGEDMTGELEMYPADAYYGKE